MTVEQWIDENTKRGYYRIIRIIDRNTHKGFGCHWLVFADCEVDHVKVTSKFIFIFV